MTHVTITSHHTIISRNVESRAALTNPGSQQGMEQRSTLTASPWSMVCGESGYDFGNAATVGKSSGTEKGVGCTVTGRAVFGKEERKQQASQFTIYRAYAGIYPSPERGHVKPLP
ncbi:hypothetical protein CBL_07954 [Carabus blaptoides fortunei]